MRSKKIEQKTVDLLRSDEDIYPIDENKVRHGRPDLIFTHGTRELCAPFVKEIKYAISILDYKRSERSA
jgi:hypothetical protein